MTVMSYRTRDGLADYGFSIEFDPRKGWQIYIIFEPFHAGSTTGSTTGSTNSATLPYQSVEDGRRRVDWSSKLDTLKEAKTVAALWAELAQRYQRTQDEHALYIITIEQQQRLHEQRQAVRTGPSRLSNGISGDRASPGNQNGSSGIPHPRDQNSTTNPLKLTSSQVKDPTNASKWIIYLA